MTVYVDNMKLHTRYSGFWGHWSNLYANDRDELLGIAIELGIADKRGKVKLIDEGYTSERLMITEKLRVKAIELGAQEVQFMGRAIFALGLEKRRSGIREKGL